MSRKGPFGPPRAQVHGAGGAGVPRGQPVADTLTETVPTANPKGMKVASACNQLASVWGRPLTAPVVAIGNFDGVHLGHKALLTAARERALALGGEAGVLTFDPHPARFFAPHLAPPMLMTLARRLELLSEAGAAFAVVVPFDAALATMEAERFVQDMLYRDLGARHLVVGYDFNFGRGRRGDGALLQAIGQRLGMGVSIIAPVQVAGLTCSSTKIREFLLEGRMDGAQMLLGRPFEITGEVVAGAGRGRTIGVPTANLRVEGDLLVKSGVYAATAQLLNVSAAADASALGTTPLGSAAVNIGTNPTFATGTTLHVEAHILDRVGDFYGARMRLQLRARLRDEQRFASPTALVDQIRQDIARAREILS